MPADVLGCGRGPYDLAADVPVEVLSHADRRGHQLPGFPREPERPRGGKAPAAPSGACERHPPAPAGPQPLVLQGRTGRPGGCPCSKGTCDLARAAGTAQLSLGA